MARMLVSGPPVRSRPVRLSSVARPGRNAWAGLPDGYGGSGSRSGASGVAPGLDRPPAALCNGCVSGPRQGVCSGSRVEVEVVSVVPLSTKEADR